MDLGIGLLGGFIEPIDYHTAKKAQKTFLSFRKLINKSTSAPSESRPDRDSEQQRAIERRIAAMVPDVLSYAQRLGIEMSGPSGGAAAEESVSVLEGRRAASRTSGVQCSVEIFTIAEKLDECLCAARIAKRVALVRLALPWHWLKGR